MPTAQINKKLYSLVLVHADDTILLGMKKRGFGEGLWNGFGGKVESGEEILAAAKRELWEEAGLIAVEIQKCGVNSFEFIGEPTILEVHIFSVEKFSGEPRESDEMRPQWFKKREIPYHTMWADDAIWLPKLLAGRKFAGAFTFKDRELINHSLKILEA